MVRDREKIRVSSAAAKARGPLAAAAYVTQNWLRKPQKSGGMNELTLS